VYSYSYILFLFCLVAAILPLSDIYSQDTIPTYEKIQIENANKFITLSDKAEQQLLGNVRLTHEEIFMFSDSAWIQDNKMEALGEVVIIQNDTINAFSDSLYYDGNAKLAKLYRNVVLKDGTKDLFSDELIYNLDTKIATFTDTATLVSQTMTLSSIRGVYNADNKLANFYDEVTIIDADMNLKTDSLRYDTDLDRAYFSGPTYITQDGKQIYCEDGFYDSGVGRAFFSGNLRITEGSLVSTAESMYYSRQDSTTTLKGNAIIIDSTSVTKGDEIILYEQTDDIKIISEDGNASYSDGEQNIIGYEIFYNSASKDIRLFGRSQVTHKTGFLDGDTILYKKALSEGLAIGEVEYVDTVENRIILTDRLDYNDSTKYYKATTINLRPLYKQIVDEDTLFLCADTLLNYTIGDTTKVITGKGNVKIYKSDFQAISDSLYYSDVDSIFRLYQNPIAWSDTTQVIGDSLLLVMSNDEISEIVADGNAMIITEEAADYYNQIKGGYIQSLLDSSKLTKMFVKGNAESIYLLKDEDDAYIGINKALCANMIFTFKENELDNILMSTEPSNTMVPMDKATQTDLRLEGFQWYNNLRPLDGASLRRRIINNPIVRTTVQEEDVFSSQVNEVLNKGIDKSEKSDNFDSKKKGR
jgi:lipopolysaccharide export system protein LptA